MKYTAAHWGAYEIHGDELKAVGDDPAPSRIGKGWASASRDKKSRILRPAVRKGWLEGKGGVDRCNDSFVEVSWDKAAELVANEITRVKKAHGNEVIYAGSYGWASAGRFHHAQSQLRRFLNLAGGFVSKRETYSHAAAEVILPHITGMGEGEVQDTSNSWPLLAEHCTLLVAFGGISGRTAQVTSAGSALHETESWLSKMKARQVCIAPQKSDMPKAEWISIRPNTDTALMLGLAHTLLSEGLHDEAFLDRYTSGWAAFCAYLLGEVDGEAKSADWAAGLCDIDADAIRQLARDMAANETMINVAWSLQRADHGEQTVWAGLALAAMLGQIGRPGSGFTFGYSGVGIVGRPTKIMNWPSVPQGINPVKDYIPVARIADLLLNPGKTYRYNGEIRTYADIRMVFWSGGNPFHHHQDLNRLSRAWERPETVVVLENCWTATARRADIVLPASTPLERHDILMSRAEPSLIYMSPVHDRVGEAMDDYDILSLIADKLGFRDAFTEGRDTEGWLRWLWDGASKIAAKEGATLPDFDAFRSMGRYEVPGLEETRIAFSDFIKDPEAHALRTESGKLTLFNETIAGFDLDDCPGHPAWMPPVESLIDAPDGALHLVTSQPDTRLHSQNDRGTEALASKIEGREVCYLHPDTAAIRGVKDGQVIKLFNERGATLAGLRLDPDMRRDCITLPTGAWLDMAMVDGQWLEVHGNPNVLTLDKGASDLTQGNIAHTTLVFVEAWTRPLPPLSIDSPPMIEPLA